MSKTTVQISTRKVTREEFMNAVSTATNVINALHPNTRLSFMCEKFLDLNHKTNKDIQKKMKEATSGLNLELSLFKAGKCQVKDDKLCKDEKGNYHYNTDGEKAVLKKQDEILKKIEGVADEFLAAEVLVKCLPIEIPLPASTTYDTKSALNGFAFKNSEIVADDTESFSFEEEKKQETTTTP